MKKLELPAKKYTVNDQNVIKITAEAHRELIDVVNESSLSIRQVASAIILYVIKNDLIEYIKED